MADKKKTTQQKTGKASGRKRKDLIYFLTVLAIIILANYIGRFVFDRFDLTSEKRFSLNEATKKQLKELDDVVYVKVYLDGDLPAGFQRLRDATKELLDEFKVHGGENVQYEFINPSESPDKKEREKVYAKLTKKGLQYNNLRLTKGDKNSEQIIFPGAIITFKEKDTPVQLLKSSIGANPEVMLNNSIQQLEYQLSSTIKKMSQTRAKFIAFIEGHGEFSKFETADFQKALEEFYIVERKEINGQINALETFDAIVIAGPDSAFSEKDKFVIDQFIMSGKKALWLIEPTVVNMDSIRKNNITMALPNSLNLEDQLFKYGCRVNTNLVMDLRSRVIPVVTGMIGNQPKQEFFPWYYYPMIMSRDKHPIVNNIDALMTSFMSSIDTVGSKSIKKTPLLRTSKFTKLANTPHRVSLNILRDKPKQRLFNKSHQIVGLLLEGEFESVFKNRLPPTITQNPDFKYKEKSIKPTKMIVLSDADMIKNRFNPKTKEFYAMGYDKFTRRVFGNKEFLMNCMNYLLDDDGLINSRGKEFKIRLLDRQRISKSRQSWQILNVALPVVLILIFGGLHFYFRKRQYTR